MPAAAPPDPGGYRYDYTAAADWRPLEQLARICRDIANLAPLDPDDFMYMGRATHPSRPPILHYKHIRTRRYLHLDAAGHVHAYAPSPTPARGAGSYKPIRNLREALARVLDGATTAPVPLGRRTGLAATTRPVRRWHGALQVIDGPTPTADLTVIVVRNCYMALHKALASPATRSEREATLGVGRPPDHVVLIREPRALGPDDVAEALRLPMTTIAADPTVARWVDAGLIGRLPRSLHPLQALTQLTLRRADTSAAVAHPPDLFGRDPRPAPPVSQAEALVSKDPGPSDAARTALDRVDNPRPITAPGRQL